MRPAVIACVLILAGLCLAPQAQARTRDEVLAGTFRCAVIGDSRLWLDCYYGAAQPLRAALGLPPAPPGQLKLAAAPPAGGAGSNLAVRDQIASAAVHCNDTAEDRAWLNCYYAAAQPMRIVLGLTPAPQSQPQTRTAIAAPPPPRPATPTSAPPEFGLRPPPSYTLPANQRDVSRLAAYSYDPHHIITITLANGEVWRQLRGDIDTLKLKKPASAYVATISRGALGSYNLHIAGLAGGYKVERVQ